MATPITLPTTKQDLESAVRRLIIEAESELRPHKIRFQVNQYYMQGIRNFDRFDYNTGTVHIAHEDHHGRIDFRLEKLTKLYMDERGRRLGMDIRPKVIKDESPALNSLRKTSTAQAVLNTMVSEILLPDVLDRAVEMQLLYGCGALGLWGQDNAYDIESDTDSIGERIHASIENIPPWQILPIPARTSSGADVRGIIRYRRVPMDWLRSREGLTPPRDGWKAIQTDSISVGQDPNQVNESTGSGSHASWKNTTSSVAQGVENVDHTWLAEIFLEDWDHTLLRYIVWAGEYILRDDNFEGTNPKERPMMPVAFFQDISAGEFYAKGFVDTLIGLNVESEHLMRNTFENYQDLDMFGFLAVPATMGLNTNQMRRAQGKPRILTFDPDIGNEGGPIQISPANIGDAPANVASFAEGLMDRIAGHSGGLFSGDAPGRVDSASALNFLYETSNIPLSAPMNSLASAISKIYSAMLGLARSHWGSETLARVTMLDDNIVGVTIDANTGLLRLDSNSVPHPTEVNITIQSTMPQSRSQRKQELVEMLQLGLITPFDFKVENFKCGLGFPIPEDAEWHAYRKAVLQNIILFGDGKTPGEIIVSEEADDPIIQGKVLATFMKRPEFSLASKEVRQKFIERQQVYQDMLGMQAPVPYPEELVDMQMQQGMPVSEQDMMTRQAASMG